MKSGAKIEKEENNLRTSVHKTFICGVLIENLISKRNVVSHLQPCRTILKSTSAEVPESNENEVIFKCNVILLNNCVKTKEIEMCIILVLY